MANPSSIAIWELYELKKRELQAMGLSQREYELTVREMRDLIELAQSFGAQQGVKFGDESRRGFDWVAAYGRAAA